VEVTPDADDGLVPLAFVATTEMLYSTPLVRPVTVMGLAVPFWAMGTPALGVAVTVYEVMGLPPLLEGATNETVS
jgi:hypothetical protein